MNDDVYQPRTYRHWIEGKDLVEFAVTIKETDLYIRATVDLHRKAEKAVMKYRGQLEKYIEQNVGINENTSHHVSRVKAIISSVVIVTVATPLSFFNRLLLAILPFRLTK